MAAQITMRHQQHQSGLQWRTFYRNRGLLEASFEQNMHLSFEYRKLCQSSGLWCLCVQDVIWEQTFTNLGFSAEIAKNKLLKLPFIFLSKLYFVLMRIWSKLTINVHVVYEALCAVLAHKIPCFHNSEHGLRKHNTNMGGYMICLLSAFFDMAHQDWQNYLPVWKQFVSEPVTMLQIKSKLSYWSLSQAKSLTDIN